MLFTPSLHLYSDQMGNKGAFITLTKDLKPEFTVYEAVVSTLIEPVQFVRPGSSYN